MEAAENVQWKVSAVLSLGVLLWSAVQLSLQPKDNDSYNLVVGILSSRSNFENRDVIRRTWLNKSHLGSSSIGGKFIVGGKFCSIPEEDRLDTNVCVEWDSKPATELGSGEIYSSSVSNKLASVPSQVVAQGFAFKVRHPIIISKLGLSETVAAAVENVTVVLKNAATQDDVVRVERTSSKPGVFIQGFYYLPVVPYVLPQGFEAVVVIEGAEKLPQSSNEQNWQNASGVIEFTSIIRNLSTNFGVRHVANQVTATAIGFSIYDVQLLRQRSLDREVRRRAWEAKKVEEDSLLQQEIAEYGDIVVVDVVDVYQNLPLKLLHFFKWANEKLKFLYLLKTDDDCVLNIAKIYEEIQKMKFLRKHFWWSRFRFNWMVDRVGKWAEHDYQAVVYPPFGCGLGNVLSAELVQWMAVNAHSLHPYQGEDVSLGIWLAAVAPEYVDDTRWNCDAGCEKDRFNVGQLTPAEMKQSWESLQTCGSLCGC